MKLENKNNRTTIFTLTSILLLSIAFIVSSVFLIQQINSAQNTIQRSNNCLHYAVNIQNNASKAIKTLSQGRAVDKQIIEESLTLSSKYEELEQLNEIFIGIKRVTQKKISFIEATLLQQELFAVEGLCNQIIDQNKESSKKNSTELNKYWTYTYITLVIACILMIILAITSLYVGKTKKQLLEEKSKNKFILNNSINVISSSDIHGNILEFNPAAQESFGYTLEEARALDYKMMYHSEKDLKKVAKALKENRIFTGEVTNRRKDGSLFISYLSANRIHNQDGKALGTMGISRDITKEKAKEQEFQNIINNAQDIIYTVTTEGEFSFVNSSGSSVMGYEDDELTGKFFTDLVHSDEVDRVRKFYINQFKKQIKRSYLEFKGITKDKEVVWLGQNITSLFSPTNSEEIIGFQGVVRDINKRKEAEFKLKKSEESFRVIVNTINDLFYLFDFRTDRFEYISPNTEEVLGVPQEFFYSGKSFFTDYVHKDDVKAVMKAEAGLLRGESYNIEYRVIANGKTRWIQDRAFPIKNYQGKVISYSGVSRNITEVKSANLIIEQQNDEISQSISYAKNIQDSLLLTTEEIYSHYTDCFVFFNPRDVLSGDFYVVDRFNTNQFGDMTTFVVADCTGHGVPGGMLSFLCNSLIREAFTNETVNSTAEVLEFARIKLAELFRSSNESHIYDGMDISICAMADDRSTIYFSGANLPITIVRNGDVFEIKGDRQHVGYSRKSEEFTTQIIDIQKGDMIFMYSDGYQDQFGGDRGKKFMKRRLRELLIKIHKLPLEDQYNLIKLEFHQWKGEYQQVDDICVMGILV
jgi:PAS domain S-box-containing protein